MDRNQVGIFQLFGRLAKSLIRLHFLVMSIYSVSCWIFDFRVNSASLATSLKSATSSGPDKGTCREIDNVYQATCNNAVNVRSNW